MQQITTERYEISVKEIAQGGPGGYEATYLTSEGDPASDELYHILDSFEGELLPASARVVRQRNGAALLRALEQKSPVGIASGFKPSGAYHFGHKLTSSAVAFFQRNGAQIFMPVADVECSMDPRISQEQYRFWAADNLLDWGANGVDLDATHVYLQSEELRVNRLAYVVARALTFAKSADTYGMEKLVSDFPFLFAGITQVGDIILPQDGDFGNYHSFMVSGQDQDGHMKMTVALTATCLENDSLEGIQTVPSGFYIPHIRGINGSKASSSKAAGTLYLGSGPEGECLDARITTTLHKFDRADPRSLESCALDMVRFIDVFATQSSVDFAAVRETRRYQELLEDLARATTREEHAGLQGRLDECLMEFAKSEGQDNVELVRETLPGVLREHQKRRQAVFDYAKSKASGENPKKPSFWKADPKARVDESKRNRTQWFDMVDAVSGRIIP